MNTITLNFKFKKETPGTYVYEEVSDEPIVPTLYVKKSAFKVRPDNLQMELKYDAS